MQSSTLLSSFAPNLSGQLLSRIISFAINMYLLRKIDGDLLGVVNVSLTLFYTTTIFIVREPFRKAFLSTDIPLSVAVNYIWLSPLLCPLVALSLYLIVWMPFSTIPPVELVPSYGWALFCFGLSAWFESVAEPFVIVSLRFAMDSEYAVVQGLLVVMQRVVVILLIFFTNDSHIKVFCWAQVFSSLFYLFACVFFIFRRLRQRSSVHHVTISSFRTVLPNFKNGFSKKHLSILTTFTIHSLFKQILTDGTGYVLTFTDRFTLSNKAVFDAVDKLGSLVARIVLAPLEHSAYLFFSANLRRDIAVDQQEPSEVKKAIDTLSGLMHLTTVVGVIVCVFAIPYSPLAVTIYGGSLLANNSGASILRLYCVYIVVIAINGITECFAMATMNNSQLFAHGRFLLIISPVHILLSLLFSLYIGSYGLIIANVVNMLTRICYSWFHIRKLFPSYKLKLWSAFPTPSTVVLLLFSLTLSSLSLVVSIFLIIQKLINASKRVERFFCKQCLRSINSLLLRRFYRSHVQIFGGTSGIMHSAAHLATGGALFLFVCNHIYQTDIELMKFINQQINSVHRNIE